MYPILFTIPWINLPIYSYGVMLGLSFIVGWVLIMHLGSIDGVAKERLAGCFIVTAVFAIVGARMLYILTNLEAFQGNGLLRAVDLRNGGLVAYGGFLGGFLGSWIYMSYYRITLWVFADVVAFALASGLGITRIGCFLFGCDWGKPISASTPAFIKAVGVRFPNWDIQFNGFREISHGLGSALADSHLPGTEDRGSSIPAYHRLNSFRVVLNAYFGQGLPLLPDRQFFAHGKRPDQWTGPATGQTNESCPGLDGRGDQVERERIFNPHHSVVTSQKAPGLVAETSEFSYKIIGAG